MTETSTPERDKKRSLLRREGRVQPHLPQCQRGETIRTDAVEEGSVMRMERGLEKVMEASGGGTPDGTERELAEIRFDVQHLGEQTVPTYGDNGSYRHVARPVHD